MRHILIGMCIATMSLGTAVVADGPAPFPEFTFKRVKPPKSGSSKRITVQIDPTASAKPVAAALAKPSSDGKAVPLGTYSWFWEGVSPRLADSGPGRLRSALIKLANPPGGAGFKAPRLQSLQEIAQSQGSHILLSTIGTRVSPALVLAVISVESGGRSDAVSGAGATGLMQLMPATAERFGVTDSLIAADNIKGGVAYLDWLLEKFDGDPILALAGYNAGENSIAKHDGVPPYAETRDYIPKVLAAFNVAKGLCRVAPELISDGCIFVTKG